MNRNNEKGITLIALIITVIVMLILAGVSLNAIIGDNGIITNAQVASFKSALAQYLEDTQTYAVALEGAAANGENIYYSDTEGAKIYFYAGDTAKNTVYSERFTENRSNIISITQREN